MGLLTTGKPLAWQGRYDLLESITFCGGDMFFYVLSFKFFMLLWLYQFFLPICAQENCTKGLDGLDLNVPDEFSVPYSDAPVVSIIIPVFNKFDYTKRCLFQTSKTTGFIPVEIIVIDDCSTDETDYKLSLIHGIRRITNRKNQGFLLSTNAGILVARGDFIVLLNNDTIPQPGWLEAMLKTFQNHDKVGLVGAKLLFPNGRIQEAGCMVLKNGVDWPYGKDKDRFDQRYGYVRRTDYSSGAAIMLPASLLRQLNGFDLLFMPAYFEDTDLAFRVRAAGFHVLYQPKAEVVHFGSVTYGDMGGVQRELSRQNRVKFVARWKSILSSHSNRRAENPDKEFWHLYKNIILFVGLSPAELTDDMSACIKGYSRRGNKVFYLLDAPNCSLSEEFAQSGVEFLPPYALHSADSWLMTNGRVLDMIVILDERFRDAVISNIKRVAIQPRLLSWFDFYRGEGAL